MVPRGGIEPPTHGFSVRGGGISRQLLTSPPNGKPPTPHQRLTWQVENSWRPHPLVAQHPPDVLEHALHRISVGGTTSHHTAWLNPSSVSAVAWNQERLDTARRFLAQGDRPPPIHAVGFHLPDTTAGA